MATIEEYTEQNFQKLKGIIQEISGKRAENMLSNLEDSGVELSEDQKKMVRTSYEAVGAATSMMTLTQLLSTVHELSEIGPLEDE